MAANLTQQQKEALSKAGSPDEIRARLTTYRNAVMTLSSKQEDLVKRYPNQWVGMAGSKVVCRGKSLPQLISDCDKKGIPRGSVAIRYLDTKKPIMVL